MYKVQTPIVCIKDRSLLKKVYLQTGNNENLESYLTKIDIGVSVRKHIRNHRN